MRRVLIVAYYFPPIGGIGSIRMAKFAEYLPEFGWDPTVIAPSETPHPQDPYLSVREDRVIRSRSIELSRLGRAVPGASAALENRASPARSARQVIRRQAHRFVFYPDAQIGWYPAATRNGARALAGAGFDAILSSSNPLTAHLVARTLHRRTGVPWAAEFRDPWSDRLGDDHPYRRHAERLEQRLALEADRVIVATPTMATHLSALWDREVDLILNGHDLEASTPTSPERPTLTHLGSYYPERQDLRAVWAAIRQLHQAGNGAVPRIRFVGDLPPELRRELEQFGLSDVIEATGFLPHADAMKAMKSSSMLIASGFSGTDPLARGVIPAKVFEYLASGLPILYVGDPHDDTWRLLDGEPGCYLMQPPDVEAAAAALASGLGSPARARDASHHSRRARTAELAAILDELGGIRRHN
jgi:glycosyltransferase involved in cell wall biosynthesis